MMQNRGGGGRGRDRQNPGNGGRRDFRRQSSRSGFQGSSGKNRDGHSRRAAGSRYPSDRESTDFRRNGTASGRKAEGYSARGPRGEENGRNSAARTQKNAYSADRGRTAGENRGRSYGQSRGRSYGESRGSAYGEGRGKTAGESRGKAYGGYRGKTYGDSRGRSAAENREKAGADAPRAERHNPLKRRDPEVRDVLMVKHPAVVSVRPNPDHIAFGRNVAEGCLVIGVTGGIGAGKSEVLRVLRDNYGAAVIRSDEVAKELMRKGGPAYPLYLSILGEKVLGPDGEVDRAKAAEILFADPYKTRKINESVHPLVLEEIRRRVEEYKKNGVKLIAIESALLSEGKLTQLTNTVWFVDTPEETRITRLQDSRGYTRERCLAVMRHQKSEQQYRREADLVIRNDGIPVDLEGQVNAAMRQYRRRF
ncbi:MAG: dephospho-CoA kinase [Lachnospiraceae bacterium]|jgi:dephospho-CoA kinase